MTISSRIIKSSFRDPSGFVSTINDLHHAVVSRIPAARFPRTDVGRRSYRPDVQKEFASSRNWDFKMYSCSENSFAKDVDFQTDDGGYWPGVSAFKKSPDGVMHRISKAYFGPGDDFCSTWHFFDLLADGPAGWEPKYSY